MRYTFLLIILGFMLGGVRKTQAQCSASAVATDVSCFGGNNGSIDLSPSGGTAPYTFVWSNTPETTEDLQGLVAGIYSCTVTDFLGCTATASATVNSPAALTVSLVGGIITCNENVIFINPTINGGTGPYTFLWSDGTTNQQHPTTIPGNYTVTVTDIQGCTASNSVVVVQDLTPPNCQFAVPGVLNCALPTQTISATCNNPLFAYFWTKDFGPVLATTPSIQVSTPGNYQLVITNVVNGCTSVYQAFVQQNQITPYATAGPDTGIPCGGGQVTLQSTGSSSGGNFQYFWTGPGINAPNQFLLNPIVTQAGVYTLIITDSSNGCTDSDQVTVYPGPAIPAQAIVIQGISCLGNDGAIDLSFTEGVAPYTYLWSNGSTTEDLNNLGAGTYTIIVKDATDCDYYGSITLTQSPAINILNTIGNPSSCASTDGLINLNVQGGVPPYTYLWSNASTNKNITNLMSGVYTVTVTDNANCTASKTITLTGSLSFNVFTNDVSCFGQSDGMINIVPSGGVGPYAFQWIGPNGFTSNQQNLLSLQAGSYTATATDINGCIGVQTVIITSPAPLILTVTPSSISCAGTATGTLTVSGISNASFFWSNNQTTQTITNLPTGTYSVTVTDLNNCFQVISDIPVFSPPPLEIDFQTLSNDCELAVLAPIVTGGMVNGQYFFQWSTGSLDSVLQVNASGNYSLTVTDMNGCTAAESYQVTVHSGLCGTLQGLVYQDIIENCLFDAEPSLGGWILKAEGTNGTFFGVSQPDGQYQIRVLPGDYSVTVFPPNALWLPCLTSIPSLSVGLNDTLENLNFPIQKEFTCPNLSVDISSSILRRCFSNNFYSVTCCNSGTAAATNAYVIITLDPFLTLISANLPHTDLGNGMFRFEIGNLGIGQCKSFNLNVQVNCNAVLGQSHCTEAHIYPDADCIPPSVLWSGASLQITSDCQADSVRFQIKNVGLGNMPNALDYIVIEDQVMLMSAPVQLSAGQSTQISVPANGSTWRLEMAQEPFHPGQSNPAVSVEGCTTETTFSTGFVTQFSADDEDDFLDIDCRTNVGAYDPNDKQAYPIGYGSDHYIRPGRSLEYQIRFQNTGTDTAFTVRIVDTLSSFLDPSTLRPGVSSHPYTWDLSGAGVLSFLFENILLPDSNVNQAASNGFVKFEISPKTTAPLETRIENTAEIYFDFNEAIVTNTTFHRLGENFVTVGLWQPEQALHAVLVTPNPFSDAAVLEVQGLRKNDPVRLQVFDLQGRLQFMMDAESPRFQINRGNLSAGTYLFKIEQNGRLIGTGKLLIQRG